MSLSLSLLTIFSKETCFGPDINAFVERSQVLSIIYLNFSIFLMVLGYELMSQLFLGPSSFIITLITIPCVGVSLAFLKSGKKEISGAILLGYMHFLNFFAAHFVEIPMATMYSLMVLPTFCSFLTSSNKIYVMNAALSLANLAYFTHKTQEAFAITLNNKQSLQVHTFLIAAAVALTSHFIASYIQKGLEKNMWKMAQSQYEKSKSLMIDVLQAVKAKEEHSEALSKMLMYPVSMISQTILQLLECQSEPERVQLLKTIQITIKILISMLTSKFELPKLKFELDKTDLAFSDVNVMGTVQRALELNKVNLMKRNNTVRVFLSENLPTTVWTDSSLYLHLIISQLMDSTRHIEQDEKIQLAMNWENENQTKEALLTLDEEYVVKDRSTQITTEHEEANSIPHNEDLHMNEFSFEDPSKSQRNIVRTNTFKKKWSLENSIRMQGERWEIFRFRAPFDRSQGLNQPLKSCGYLPKESIGQRGYLKIQFSYTATSGLTQEETTKIFNYTCQSFGNSNDGTKTTHLGLLISKHLCLKLGGDQKVYNQSGQVITCVLYIPVNMNQRTASVQRINSAPRDRVSAMIIDGYTYTRDLNKFQLERKGVMVTTAASSKEAFEKFKTKDEEYFDFIMIDGQTLETSGIETVKKIREWEAIQQRKKVDIYVASDFESEEEIVMDFGKRTGGIASIEGVKRLIKPLAFETLCNLANNYKKDGQRSLNKENSRNLENQIPYLISENSGVRRRKEL